MRTREMDRKEDGRREEGARKTDNQKWAVKVAVGMMKKLRLMVSLSIKDPVEANR